jgi:ketosteroid isomerase-like protein
MLSLLLAAALVTAEAEMPRYPDLPPDLAAAALAFDKAQVSADGAALRELLADDYLLVNSRGQHENKADFIRDYTTPGFTFAPFTIEQRITRIWSDGAVLGGVVDAHGMGDGKPYAIRLRFTDVWAKRKGRWQVIFTDASRAPAAT